ncbi:MAG: DUF2203 family protein [Vampirovibrionales bacterium]|nr:DUF2203 family protein [Vampirovibrionales bacterium]
MPDSDSPDPSFEAANAFSFSSDNDEDGDSYAYFFTLEEAALLARELSGVFEQAHDELSRLQDDVILYKRIHLAKRREPLGTNGDELDVLQEKWTLYEAAFNRWNAYFAERHILLRDIGRGLVDFPYRAQDGSVYLLCWRLGEDGVLSFHGPDEGFMGRKPITLLPD